MFMKICGRILRQLEEWIATMNRSSNPAYLLPSALELNDE
jgi:hypothetical protein